MEINVIKYEKDELEIELDNLTIAELLRNLLWEDKATEFAAWKREHPTKNPHIILRTKGKDSKKVLLDTIELAKKTNSQFIKEFKKAF
jgi:DNA-directed RNA polymerase subunit L